MSRPGAAGELVVVSTPIGNLADLAPRAAAAISAADIVCCEDTRHTGSMLKRLGIRSGRLLSLHAHNEADRVPMLLDELRSGRSVALVSDAGTPAVSDPGERLVAAAARAGIRVSPVPGPSAVLAALVVSGMGLARWRFEGFLPRKGGDRRKRLEDIASSPSPSVCYESPHRVGATLSDLAEVCGGDRRVVLARELTKLYEQVQRVSLAEAVRGAEASGELRGEHVLVVDGAPARQVPASASLDEPLRRLLDAGVGRRDAVTAVVTLLGASRHDAYEASLRVSRD